MAAIIFSAIFAWYTYTTRNSSALLKSVFFPDMSLLEKIEVNITDKNSEKVFVIVRNKNEIFEFVRMISASYNNQVNPNGSRYYGDDFITYFYDGYNVRYMISLEKGGEVHARIYSSITEGWHYGRYRVDGFMDFMSSHKDMLIN